MKYRILIIDDNPAIHNDIRKILATEENGPAALEDAEAVLFGQTTETSNRVSFETDSAFQGEEGLDLVKKALESQQPYPLAFVDIRMPPGWDGIETISRIWEIAPELQVVICTAYSDYSWEDMTRKIGNSDSILILKKPFDNIEVLQMAHALTKKWVLTQESKSRLLNLDKMVNLRTEELQIANKRLTHEIEERNQAEKQLRLSEDRFAKAFKSSPTPMSIQSLNHYWYLDANDSYLEMTGYDRDELLGKDPFALELWVEMEARKRLFEQLRQGESIRNVETKIRPKAGNQKTTLFSAEPITLDNDHFALINENDVSQRLELESQLRQAQKMEAIGQLAAGVAHDFRNIMTVIQGHASLRMLTPNLPVKLAESLKQITEAVERASNLTNQLLAFSRKQIMRFEVVDINKLLAQISLMFSRLIGEHISLRCQCEENLPCIEGDVCSLEQVILNLVVNSRDAMPNGGELTISTETTEIGPAYLSQNSEAKMGKFVCLTIADTGCGMDEAIQARLFEPFFTTKEVGKGTGMGLATAYGIVKQHDGWIEVESKAGEGSVFRVYLPVTEKSVEQEVKVQSFPLAKGGKETILVVEDEEPVREFVSKLLVEFGYEVLVAQNSLEALKIWERSGPSIDLLLTDVVMPEQLSGIELSDRLCAQKPELKVIYTSGYSIELLGPHFRSRSDVTFLPKPYHPLKLVELVRVCLMNGSL